MEDYWEVELVDDPYMEKVRYHTRMITFYKRVWNSAKSDGICKRLIRYHAFKRLNRHYSEKDQILSERPWLR